MATLKRIGVTIFVGFAGMLVLWGLAFLLAPKKAVTVYLFPGVASLRAMGIIIPNKIVYFLFPSGGLDATVGFSAIFATVFWGFIGIVSTFFAFRKKWEDKGKPRVRH